MNLVCLDSHYFGWALLNRSTIGQEEMIPKAKAFFKFLEEQDTTILVPTPLVTELLMKAELDEREAILATLSERFHVVEFDLVASKLAADIWNAKKRSGVIDEIIQTGVSMRTKIKIDLQILGVAVAANAGILYTEDKEFRKLAEGSMLARQMPVFESQLELFSE